MPIRECRGMAGRAYHVMNRATCGQVLFDESEDYLRFLCTLQQARAKVPIRLLSYCLMPNHWHLVLWPAADDDVMRLTIRVELDRDARQLGETNREVVVGAGIVGAPAALIKRPAIQEAAVEILHRRETRCKPAVPAAAHPDLLRTHQTGAAKQHAD